MSPEKNIIRDLFDQEQQRVNILPSKGEAFYYGKVMSEEASALYFKRLNEEIEWKNESLRIAGKEVKPKRRVAWYGDEAFEYKYSGVTKTALPWTGTLLILKDIAETYCKCRYNSCLLNFYADGESAMSWHSDNESSLTPGHSIACISLGAARKFYLKQPGSQHLFKALLENGSLFEMKGETQRNWLHSLPKSKTIREPRISLTFRRMIS